MQNDYKPFPSARRTVLQDIVAEITMPTRVLAAGKESNYVNGLVEADKIRAEKKLDDWLDELGYAAARRNTADVIDHLRKVESAGGSLEDAITGLEAALQDATTVVAAPDFDDLVEPAGGPDFDDPGFDGNLEDIRA